MSHPADVLTMAVMCDALQTRGVDGLLVEVFDSLPSTSQYLNAVLKASPRGRSLASDKPQLCVADWQTNGSGRRGKSWVTERGNITFSMLLTMKKPPAELMGLSLVTGICVADSLAALAGVTVNLKWPNDVLVEDRKLCGLLTELVSSPSNHTQVVVGIGINYKQPEDIETTDYQAVSVPALTSAPPSRAELISDVCARVINEYALFELEGWPAFAQRWNVLDYLKGREVRVLTGDKEERAVAMGVDECGALLVEADGVVRAVYSGDVSMRLVRNEPNSQR